MTRPSWPHLGSSRWRCRVPGICATVLLAGAVPTEAQQAQPATLEVIVLSAATGQPIVGADVRVPKVARVVTDRSGIASFPGLQPTAVTVVVSALGYDGRSLTMDLPAGETFSLTIPVEVDPVLLAEVRVGAGPGEIARSRELQDFYRRARFGGTGQYITRAEIDRRRARDLSDLFRMLPGVSLLDTPAGDKPVMESKTSASAELFVDEADCPIQYFVDGSPIVPIHDGVLGAEVRLSEIEGIEIYRRGSGVPAKFHRLNNSCGVILIWKKEKI